MIRTLGLALRALVLLISMVNVAAAQTITVYSSGNLVQGTTRQLTAYVPLSPNTVTWSVNGVPGGNATVGTVSSTGLYAAPAVIPSPNAVTVTATSTAYPAKSGSVTMTITQVQPRLWSVNPTSVGVGAFTLNLNGASFGSNAVVRFGGVALATTWVSSTRLSATGMTTMAQAGQRVSVDVLAPGLGAISSDVVSVTVTNTTSPPPQAITVTVAPASVALVTGASQVFGASVAGSSNQAVSWSVNGIAGGNGTVGTVSAAGLYIAPAAVPSPATVSLRATAAANGTASGTASITISAGAPPPPPAPADLASARLLDQAAFGPTPAELARVKTLGVNAWLAEQLAMPETTIPDPGQNGNTQMQAQYLARLSSAPDQLRQRVAYALAQVFVISMNKNNYPPEVVPFLQILSRNAFGNYRTLLGEVAISSQMGKYLDMANSNKPGPGSSANENFPRELLQLFSIGLLRLNADGTPMLDANGQTIPTYGQADIQQLALAFTGWTYAGTGNNNWENFSGPLVPRDVNHDMRAKSLLGCNLPANQTAQQDMNAALDCVFRHPNVGPFVSLRLIRQMVKSNPSPGYVARVAATFDNNGSGVRGDLRAVVRAVLVDSEARDDNTSTTTGRLRDPVQHLVALLRQLGGSVTASNQLGWELGRTGETPLAPPSVFGFYSPLFRVPQTTLNGPEFQIYSPTEAVLRGNLFWRVFNQPGGDFTLSLAPFTAVAANTTSLIDRVDQILLYGRMPAGMRQVLATAINAQSDNTQRMLTALYLTVLSGQHAVQF